MTNFQHLTKNQILAYSNESLSEVDAKEIGRHLLNCEICRQSLPIPTVAQFRSAIMTDSEREDKLADKKTVEVSSIVSGFSSFLNFNSNLNWSGATLIVLISFSALIWFSVSNSNREIAGMIDQGGNPPSNFELSGQKPIVTKSPLADPDKVLVTPTPKILRSSTRNRPPLPKITSKLERERLNKKERIFEVRGSSTNCAENKDIGLEIFPKKDNFVFRWKKVVQAVKYNLYISDEEEILIDEFETDKETSFVLNKPLDPLKIYQWKIIVTLENGKRIISAAQKFKVKTFDKNQFKFEKKRISDSRCSTNK